MSIIICTEKENVLKSMVGQAIAELRHSKNITQEELADRMGVATRTLSEIENGKCAPNLITLNRAAEGLGILLEDLIHYAHELEKGN